MQGWERVIYALSVQRPDPIDRKKRKGKMVEDKRGRAAYANKKSIGSALETRQSDTVKYRISKIVQQGH